MESGLAAVYVFAFTLYLLNFGHSVAMREDKLTLYISVCLTIDYRGSYPSYNTGINYSVY